MRSVFGSTVVFAALMCSPQTSPNRDQVEQLLEQAAAAQTAAAQPAGPVVPGFSVPGFGVLVRKHGQTLLERSLGVKDLRDRSPIDARTNFRLASCTKQFTAISIMLLVHDRRLRYDQSLTEIFPGFPVYGQAITVRHLLNHTSGLPDYEDLMDRTPGKWTESHQINDQEVLTLLEAEKTGKFAPGTQWSYSNSGYVMLGLIIAKVSGESFPEFLHQRIFAPLKMNSTLAFVNGTNTVPNRAFGHSKEGGRFVQTDQSSTSATLGDGGIYSNLQDLAKWDHALAAHTLLGAKEMQPALEPVRLPDGSLPKWSSDPGDDNPQPGKAVQYGFGWFLDPYKDHARMWHYGDTVGFKSAIMRFPNDGLTVVVLSNRADLDAPKLALAIADVYLTERVKH